MPAIFIRRHYAYLLAAGRTLKFVQWSCGLDVSRSGLNVSRSGLDVSRSGLDVSRCQRRFTVAISFGNGNDHMFPRKNHLPDKYSQEMTS